MIRISLKISLVSLVLLLLLVWTSFISAEEQKGIYASITDPAGEIAKSIEIAGKECRRIMLVFGADWCPWCNRLAKYFNENEKVAGLLSDNYLVVKVDLGKWDKNLDLKDKYRVDRKAGLPSLVVLEKSGDFITFQETGSLEEGKGYSEKNLSDFLGKYSIKNKENCIK